jgi:hypothetical protein
MRPGDNNAKRPAKMITVVVLNGARPINPGIKYNRAAKINVWMKIARPFVYPVARTPAGFLHSL